MNTNSPNENQEKHSGENAIENLSSYLRSDGAPESAVEDLEIIYTELSTLRKELEAAKKNAGEVLNEMRAYCGECEFDETDTLMKPTFDRLKKITGEFLNNGKDGQ